MFEWFCALKLSGIIDLIVQDERGVFICTRQLNAIINAFTKFFLPLLPMAEHMTKTIKSLNDFVASIDYSNVYSNLQKRYTVVLKFPEIVYYNRNVIELANKMHNFCKVKYKINCE